jgi:putative flippase GtrA
MKLKNSIKELLLYLIVGVIATLAEWIFFYIGDKFLLLHYTIATVIAYIISTFINWLAGRLLVFKQGSQSLLRELISIYLSSIIGLGLNILIMFVCVDIIHISEMISKVIATGIVFFFNFLVRKFYIYKQKN